MERAIEPIAIALLNGEERQFLLGWAGFKRVMAKLGVKGLKEMLELDITVLAPLTLYEAMRDKGTMTQEEFEEQLPASLSKIQDDVMKLLGLQLGQKNPPTPTPTIQ